MRYPLLDSLRGLAALWVFTFHYSFSESFKETFPFLQSLFSQGDLGVPMFFVISGYCITASADSFLRRNKSVADFVRRRFKRIYPTYWLSVPVVVAVPFVLEGLSYLKTGHFIWPQVSDASNKFLEFSAVDWLGFLTLHQAFSPMEGARFLQDKFTGLNAVYWTLAIEVQFYLVIAFCMLARTRFYFLIAAVTLLSIPFVFWPSAFVFGIFLPYWLMFFFGVLLFCLISSGLTFEKFFPRQAGELNARRVGVVGVALVLSLFLILVWRQTVIEQFFFSGLFALFLWLAHPLKLFEKKPESKLIVPFYRVLMLLGAMSYSLYLLHGKLQHLSHALLRQVLEVNSIGFDLALVGLTCALIYPFYLFCERPFIGNLARQGSKPMLGLKARE